MEFRCRTCLSEEKDLISIYDNHEINDEKIKISNLLTICSSIKIKKNDGLPKYVCIDCLNSAEHSYNFRQLCCRSEKLLQDELNGLFQAVESKKCENPIKSENKSEIFVMDVGFDEDFGGTIEILDDEYNLAMEDDSFIRKSEDFGDEIEILESEYPDNKCPICNLNYPSVKALTRHILIHQVVPSLLKCHFCPRQFLTTEVLEKHLKLHKNESPIEKLKKFKCEACIARFFTDAELQTHFCKIHGSGDENSVLGNESINTRSKNLKLRNVKLNLKGPKVKTTQRSYQKSILGAQKLSLRSDIFNTEVRASNSGSENLKQMCKLKSEHLKSNSEFLNRSSESETPGYEHLHPCEDLKQIDNLPNQSCAPQHPGIQTCNTSFEPTNVKSEPLYHSLEPPNPRSESLNTGNQPPNPNRTSESSNPSCKKEKSELKHSNSSFKYQNPSELSNRNCKQENSGFEPQTRFEPSTPIQRLENKGHEPSSPSCKLENPGLEPLNPNLEPQNERFKLEIRSEPSNTNFEPLKPVFEPSYLSCKPQNLTSESLNTSCKTENEDYKSLIPGIEILKPTLLLKNKALKQISDLKSLKRTRITEEFLQAAFISSRNLKKFIKTHATEETKTKNFKSQNKNYSEDEMKLQSKSHLAEQKNTNTFESQSKIIYGCKICDFESKTLTEGKKHLIKTHELKYTDIFSNLKYNCMICTAGFEKIYDIFKHNVTHSPRQKPTAKTYVCEICFRPCKNLSRYREHKKSHSQKWPRKCHFCPEIIQKRGDYNPHMNKKHENLKEFICNQCGKRFFYQKNLTQHLQIHKGERKYMCDICGWKFQAQNNLVSHLKIHSDEKSYKCPHCPKVFAQSVGLRSHMINHTGDRKYECDICHKKFLRIGSRNSHRKIHTGQKDYACPLCEKKFTASSTRNKHLLTHTGEKNEVCEFCNKAFSRKSALTVHRKIHTGETPHVCEICGKGFIQKHVLRSHLSMHRKKGHEKIGKIIFQDDEKLMEIEEEVLVEADEDKYIISAENVESFLFEEAE